MNQEKPEEFISKWKARLDREKAERRDGKVSFVLFRFAENWFGLPTRTFQEIVEPRKVRRIPHRTNEILLGLVNVRGGLHLCVNLRALLKVAPSQKSRGPGQIPAFRRMVLIEKEGNAWAFHVDEIHSLYRVAVSDVVRFSNPENISRGIIEWQGKTVDLLDENLLFQTFARSLE